MFLHDTSRSISRSRVHSPILMTFFSLSILLYKLLLNLTCLSFLHFLLVREKWGCTMNATFTRRALCHWSFPDFFLWISSGKFLIDRVMHADGRISAYVYKYVEYSEIVKVFCQPQESSNIGIYLTWRKFF